VRRLALLVAAGALWLFICAVQVLADGGPHVLTLNNGTSGLAGDCASCHRAHTAQAADLLREEVPGLCTNCHNGTKATTDVVEGVQFVPTGVAGQYSTSQILGALRGGGFSYALIDSSNASRLVYAGTQLITFSETPTGGTFTISWGGNTSVPIAAGATAATVQAAIQPLFGLSTTYTTATAGTNMSNATANNATVSIPNDPVTGSPLTTQYTINFQNELRLSPQPLLTTASSLTGASGAVTISVADTSAERTTAHVGVLTSGAAVTSTHEGTGTVWGNGAVNSGAGPTGVVLDCAKCHNPHGNGQYRILQTTPGEDWSSTTPTFTEATQAVEVQDVPDSAAVHNYTVLPGTQAQDVVTAGYDWSEGDYFRKTYDPSGASNWTNFYLKTDPMNTGWDGASATNKAANGNVAPANTTGLMTAWCITCHTRYSGLPVQTGTTTVTNKAITSPSSLTAMVPTDSLFMFKHGTTRIGCEQCHVAHGSNALMTAAASSAVDWPDGTPGGSDSRLLKVDNRGTCNLCHDPTGSLDAGTTTGVVPGTITPGP
jgi:predicted CXXCH cytochrome family protein